MKKLYEKIKEEMGTYAFEIGIVGGILLAVTAYSRNDRRLKRVIISAMENGTFHVVREN